MPRNPDGTFSRVINWTEEQENVATYTGAKMDSDADDLAQGVEEALDVYGRNSLKNDIDCGGFKFKNSRNATKKNDLTTLDDLLRYTNIEIFFNDNGSDVLSGLIKLKTDLENIDISNGFKFSFIAPFTMAANSMLAKKGYEEIELSTGTGSTKGYVLRASFEESNDYDNGFKDNRPSFIRGIRYSMELVVRDDKNYFRLADGNIEGQSIDFWQNNYTPAGYLDLGYNYKDKTDLGFYRFLASYNPKKDSKFSLGSIHKAMIPEHSHTYNSAGVGYIDDGSDKVAGLFSSETSGALLDTEKVVIGDDLFPSHACVRILLKM